MHDITDTLHFIWTLKDEGYWNSVVTNFSSNQDSRGQYNQNTTLIQISKRKKGEREEKERGQAMERVRGQEKERD